MQEELDSHEEELREVEPTGVTMWDSLLSAARNAWLVIAPILMMIGFACSIVMMRREHDHLKEVVTDFFETYPPAIRKRHDVWTDFVHRCMCIRVTRNLYFIAAYFALVAFIIYFSKLILAISKVVNIWPM